MPDATKVLLTTAYLPPPVWFAAFLRYGEVWLEACEHYQKGSFRNRCYLAGPNGAQMLSIPLASGKNEQLPIRDVCIAYDEPWQRQHWQTIRTAYGSAPFFHHFADRFEPFFRRQYRFLFDFNLQLLELVGSAILTKVNFHLSENYQPYPAPGFDDLRQSLQPKSKTAGSVGWYSPATYPQIFESKHGFLPNLSTLDLLFCTGPAAQHTLHTSVST